MVGVPVIINHKDLNKDNADDERVGVVNSVWYDDKDGWYWCDGIIWNETAQNLITDKNWSVSCSYDVKTANDEGGSENNIKYDMEFLDGVFTHLALVDNPRYERANIVFNSKTVIENNNFNPNQKRNERGQWVKDDALIQQKKDSLNPIQIDASDIPQFESKEELGNWFRKIFEDLGSVTITDTGIKIDLYGGNADRESFKRRFQQEPNKAVAKAFEEIVTTSIKVDEREKDENHKHDQEIYYNKLKLGQDNFDVNLFVDYLAPNKEYRYAGHKTTKIDNKISTRDTQVINHIMLTKVDNNIINDVESDFNPNVKENEEMNVENDKWITKYDKEGEPYHVNIDDTEDKEEKQSDKKDKQPDKKEDKKEAKEDKKVDLSKYSTEELEQAQQTYKSNLGSALEYGDDQYNAEKQMLDDITKELETRKKADKKADKKEDKVAETKILEGGIKESQDKYGRTKFTKENKWANVTSNGGRSDSWIASYGQSYLSPVSWEREKGVREEQLFDSRHFKTEKGARKWALEQLKRISNDKEQEMALLEELKKLITKVENDKGEKDMEIENAKVDKRKLIDEVAGMMKSAGCDDEVIRTAIGKMEKLSYDKSEADTADNEKDEKEAKCCKAKNEDDEKEVEEIKEEVKEDVENKCKNSVDNSKTDYFSKLNKIYNAVSQAQEETSEYVSRADREKAAEDYFAK